MSTEIVRQTLLILQIFFSDHPREARLHITQPDIATCYNAAKNAQLKIRKWEGRKVSAIGAGCYVEFEPVGEDM